MKENPGNKLNLLLITMDDLDGSIPGFISGRPEVTPCLDELARHSHRLVANRTVSPICMPARHALMTGLYPHRSGGLGFLPIREGVPTLVTLLKEAGYHTGVIHKADHMQPASSFPWDYRQQSRSRHPALYADGVAVAIAEATAQRKPFFINCNLNDPHRPFYGSPEADRFDQGQTGAFRVGREFTPEDVDLPPQLEDLPDVRLEVAQYWNSIRRADGTLGRVMEKLEESGAAGETVVIFCSDHGMPFPLAKATCYDRGTHVPMLIRWPGMGTPTTFLQQTTTLDLLPTLCELLKLDPPEALDGQSVLPLLKGEAFAEPEFQFTQVDTVASGMAYPMRAVHDGCLSLVFSPFADGELKVSLESMRGLTHSAMLAAAKTNPAIAARVDQYLYGTPMALYHLREDPGQSRNLIADPAFARPMQRMLSALKQQMRRTDDPQRHNLERWLDGKPMAVPQDPERFRLRE